MYLFSCSVCIPFLLLCGMYFEIPFRIFKFYNVPRIVIENSEYEILENTRCNNEIDHLDRILSRFFELIENTFIKNRHCRCVSYLEFFL